MTTVTFTHEYDTDSTAVDSVYYNANDQTLVADLHNSLYRYSNVPQRVYDDLVELANKGRSIGRIWLPLLKRNYGPGEYIGEYYDVRLESLRVNVVSDVATASDASGESTPHLSLVSKSGLSNFDVVFRVENKTHTHSLYAGDEAEAVRLTQDVAEMLDLDFKIVAVTHYFE